MSVALSSLLVAGVFLAWREGIYEKRAAFLYGSIRGDDHVLVPMMGDHATATAMLAARLAGAHDAGKVVLLDLVDDEAVARAERELLESEADTAPRETNRSDDDRGTHRESGQFDEGALDELDQQEAVTAVVERLEATAHRIETKVGVPSDVVVAVDGDTQARTILQVTDEAHCDLIAVPYAEQYGSLSPTIRHLLAGDVDVIVHRSHDGQTRWRRIMVPVRKAGGVAHSMIDVAKRLAGETGHVSVCHCIDDERRRGRAEEMLADLVETVSGRVETRVPTADIQRFLADNAGGYDLVIIGSSQDRSTPSRIISPPTFERLDDVEANVAIVDRTLEAS